MEWVLYTLHVGLLSNRNEVRAAYHSIFRVVREAYVVHRMATPLVTCSGGRHIVFEKCLVRWPTHKSTTEGVGKCKNIAITQTWMHLDAIYVKELRKYFDGLYIRWVYHNIPGSSK